MKRIVSLINLIFFTLNILAQPVSKGTYRTDNVIIPDTLVPTKIDTPYKSPLKRIYYYAFISPINKSISDIEFKSKEEAKRLGESLENLCRFEYYLSQHVFEESDKNSIEKNLDSICGDVSYSTIIIFMSGHGIKDEVDGHYYFAAKDSHKNIASSCVSDLTIHRTLDRLADSGNTVILFLDTCHSAAIFNGYSPRTHGMGSICIYASCAANQSSWEYKEVGGSSFAINLADALKGSITEAVTPEGNITYSSLGKFINNTVLSSATHPQSPSYKLFGKNEDFPIFSNLYQISYYLSRVKRYKEEIDNVKNAINKREFKQALQSAAKAEKMSIDSRDAISGYTLTDVTKKFSAELESASIGKLPELLDGISFNEGYIDKTILNECTSFVIQGDAWLKEWKKAVASSVIIESPSSFNINKYKSKNDCFHKAMSCYIEANKLDPYNPKLVQSLSGIHYDRTIMTKEEKEFLISYGDQLFKDRLEYARFLLSYVNEEHNDNFNPIPYCETVIAQWNTVPESERSYHYAIEVAKAYKILGQTEMVQTILAPYVLKTHSKKDNYFYSDFSDTMIGFDIFVSTLQDSKQSELLAAKEKDLQRNNLWFHFTSFLSSTFCDTRARIGGGIHTAFEPYPIGGSFEIGYSVLRLSAEYTFGRGCFIQLGSSIKYPSDISETIVKTETLVTRQWSISAGINAFSFLSLGIGFGRIVTSEFNTYNLSKSISTSTALTGALTIAENRISKGSDISYPIIKPEIVLYIPISSERYSLCDFFDECKDATNLVSIKVGYMVCPQNNGLNGVILGIGYAYQFGQSPVL